MGNLSLRNAIKALLSLACLSFAACLCEAQSVTSLSISPNQPSLNIGGTAQLSATANYSDGSSRNVGNSVVWNSADPRIVSVSATGLASGNATGIVAVTATYQGRNASTAVASSIGNIQWSGPLTIIKGGTYSGNFKSTDPNTAAISVATTEPVVIENSYLSSGASLIFDGYYGNNLTVKNVIGIGANPNVAGQTNGLFIDAQNPIRLDVENCYFENVVYGIWIRGYSGNRDGTQTITILNNRGRNILGLKSDGKNGYLSGETDWSWSHAIMLSNVNSVPDMQIAWNEIVNYPNQSQVEENFNFYQSGGTASSRAEIHDNYIQGAYSYLPATDGASSGGGIVTDGNDDTVQTASAFLNIYNNQIVGTVNVGIEFSTGHDNTAYNNRIISSGLLPNGIHISAQNVGLSLFDVYGNIQRGSMYNNNMYNNTVGWMCWAARCAWDGYRNDEYFPDNAGYYSANTSISPNLITSQMEASEYLAWMAKVSSAAETVGPVVFAVPPTDGPGSSASSAISSTAWYSIANTSSKLCLDASERGSANGTTVLQYTCGASQANQQWQFQPTDSGYYEVVNRNALNVTGHNLVWDVTGGAWATANLTPLQLWTYTTGSNQQWMPVSLGNGAYKFIARNSSKCLDVPGSSTGFVRLQQYDCNGTAAQSFTLLQR
jgi:hypothetical protein